MNRRDNSKQATGDENDPQGMEALKKHFLEWLMGKNYSDKTVLIRRVSIGYFIEWAAQRGVVRPSEVTPPVLERYQRYLFCYRKQNGDPLSVRTQISRLNS